MLMAGLGVWAQTYCVKPAEDIPEEAAVILVQRFTQMLEAGGLTVADEGIPLTVGMEVKERMETPGAMSQIALQMEIRATAGDVEGIFPVKGVGENEADAWVRAAKQLLPRSKAAQTFVAKL